MPFIHRPGNVQIYYEVHGSGEPLLLSHGFSSTSQMWKGQISSLSKDFQLILWDMRGHGKSSYPEELSLYSEAHTVGDMWALLSEVAKTKKSIVGGLSLGGYMSLAFYRAHPDKVSKLLIIDTGPGFKNDKARDEWNGQAYKMAAKYERNGLEILRSGSPEQYSVDHRNMKGLVQAAKGMLTQRNDAVMRILPAIKTPALIIVGAEDKNYIAAADYMANKISNAEKVVIPNAGHASNIDQPESFNTAVLTFLGKYKRNSSHL